MEETFSIVSIIGYLILSAFFSGSETAFFSLSKLQLIKIEKEASKNSRRIVRLLKNPRELLIIILLGNTLVNVAASSTAAIIAINIGEKYLIHTSKSILLTSEIIIMTLLLLVFGEITPKLLAFSSPKKFAKISSFLLEIVKYVFWPLIKILELISTLFSTKKTRLEHGKITTEDIKNLVKSESTQHSLEETEKKIISSIFRFSTTSAKGIMVPRVDIEALDYSQGLSNAVKLFNNSGHSKIPVYKKSIDNITGILYAKDVILNSKTSNISSLLRPPIIVTENVKIQKLFNQFKTKKIQIAIVVDEYGGTSGLITLEDILEELVGEIRDELDKEKPLIVPKNDDEYVISGMYSIVELNEEFELNIDDESYDNLADFLFDQFNRIPVKHEIITLEDNTEFEIIDLVGQRIQYVKMRLKSQNNENKN